MNYRLLQTSLNSVSLAPGSTSVQNGTSDLSTRQPIRPTVASDQATDRPVVLPPLTLPPLTFLISLIRPAAPSAQLVRYRGTASGWQPIGQSRTLRDAKRLQHYLARINPEATLKLIPSHT